MCTVYLVRIFSKETGCVHRQKALVSEVPAELALASSFLPCPEVPASFSIMPVAVDYRSWLDQLFQLEQKVTDYITAVALCVYSDGQGRPALVKGHFDNKKSLSRVLVGMVHGISWVGRLLNGRVWQGSGYIPDTTERKKSHSYLCRLLASFRQGLQFAV